jgi:hypothetical protein
VKLVNEMRNKKLFNFVRDIFVRKKNNEETASTRMRYIAVHQIKDITVKEEEDSFFQHTKLCKLIFIITLEWMR